MNIPIDISEIKKAHDRIKPFIHRTPVLNSENINRIIGSILYFKCENFQKVGAFKARGATNTVLSLSKEELKKGVATHSSGNHAAALALAANRRNVKAHIVMPKTAPKVKVEAVRGYGGEIIFCEPTLKARESTLEKIVEETGATFIHPYDNYNIIAGQGTAALELLEQVSELDLVMAPIGGGGLMSGTALTVSSVSPNTKIFGVEPAGADDALRSFQQGKIIPSVNPITIADGLLTSLSEKTFQIITKHVNEILTVKEETIVQAMKLIWERMKIVVEPSAAVPFAAVMEHDLGKQFKKIGIILSGGNVNLKAFWDSLDNQID
jgi:threonine dehydratase